MKEIDSALQEQIFISAYWPQRTADELHVGYGISKDYLTYQGLSIAFILTSRIFSLFFEPRIRSLSALLRIGPVLVINLLLAILLVRQQKRIGFYQLDERGKPTFFIGRFPPESIQGCVGVGQKKFLQRISNQ